MLPLIVELLYDADDGDQFDRTENRVITPIRPIELLSQNKKVNLNYGAPFLFASRALELELHHPPRYPF